MEKNRQKRDRTSYEQDEYRRPYRERQYDSDRETQRTNYGNENSQRNYGWRNSDYYGPDYGNDNRGEMSRSQQQRGAYDQSRWPNDNDYNSHRQYDQFNRYQDYDRGFNNVGGYGGSSDYDPSWRSNDRNQGLTRNRNFNSQGNWDYGNSYGDSSGALGYGGSGSGYYGDDSYRQRSNYGNRNYNDYSQHQGYNDYGQRNQQDRSWWDRSRDEVSSWFGDDDAQRRRRMDEMEKRSHRGKGPKDYQRSESRIKEDVSDRLSDDDDLDASDIDVKVSGNEVILSGTVENREAKRRAEDIAECVLGVSNVQNQLKVGQTQSSTGSSMSSSSKEKAVGNSLKPEKMHHN